MRGCASAPPRRSGLLGESSAFGGYSVIFVALYVNSFSSALSSRFERERERERGAGGRQKETRESNRGHLDEEEKSGDFTGWDVPRGEPPWSGRPWFYRSKTSCIRLAPEHHRMTVH
jgi:hypothetical protein